MIRAAIILVILSTAVAALAVNAVYSNTVAASTEQQRAQGAAGVPDRPAGDSAERPGRRAGGQPRPNEPFRPDMEALPGGAASGGASWFRVFGLILLGLTAIIAAYAGIRWIAPRVRRKPHTEEFPLVFPVSDHIWPAVDENVGPGRQVASPAPQPQVSNHSGAGTVHVAKAAEGTLQLLPGRLEVASGNDRLKEIRFVKGPGPPVVTFGRQAGKDPTHIQVESPTVSRMHASMRFDAGRWRIKNLSGTNPVLLNGLPLPANDTEHVLNDGDQVEMGEMIFRFRSR